MTNFTTELPCILIVDDDDDQLFLTRRMLEREGVRHPIVEARGGPEAIEYLSRCCPAQGVAIASPPALVFLDLKMPTADGFAVLNWIRSRTALCAMKVIVLTSSDDAGDMKRCTALGAHAYLMKHPPSLVIRSVLRQALGTDSTTDSPRVFLPHFGAGAGSV